MRDLIKDTLPLIEEEKKHWYLVDSNLGPLEYEPGALITLSPPLLVLLLNLDKTRWQKVKN